MDISHGKIRNADQLKYLSYLTIIEEFFLIKTKDKYFFKQRKHHQVLKYQESHHRLMGQRQEIERRMVSSLGSAARLTRKNHKSGLYIEV